MGGGDYMDGARYGGVGVRYGEGPRGDRPWPARGTGHLFVVVYLAAHDVRITLCRAVCII